MEKAKHENEGGGSTQTSKHKNTKRSPKSQRNFKKENNGKDIDKP